MGVRIAIHQADISFRVDRPLMRRAARAVLRGEAVSAAELSLAFVDDAASARINWQFLNHRGPTDVITFPLAHDPLAGELVIGAIVAQRVAAERGHDVQAELALYVVHGVLHLCGYDDKSAAKRRVMRERERAYLAQLRLPIIADP